MYIRMNKEKVYFLEDDNINFPDDYLKAITLGNRYLKKYPQGCVFINDSILCFPEKKFRKDDSRIEIYVYDNEWIKSDIKLTDVL